MSEKLEIVEVDIALLKPSEYNPRQATDKEYSDLKTSIENFGLVDPIICNNAPARKNIVIGGHFRLRIARDLGFKVVPVVYVNIPDIEREKELNLRLNKNSGSWDYDLLANFDEEMLSDVGFTGSEIGFFDEELIEPQEVELKAFKKTHVLLSFSPDKLIDIQEALEQIKNTEGIEYEQSSN
jgi:ParB-like chromosome segregation protein Spo0J